MYSITNLAFTRDAPNRRYLKSPLARKGRVVIGARKVPPGRTITLSEAVFRQFERRIRVYGMKAEASRSERFQEASYEKIQEAFLREDFKTRSSLALYM